MSISNYTAKKSDASFEEKVNSCLKDIVEFSSIIKNIHDILDCDDNCEVGYFVDELYHYLKFRRRGPSFVKKIFSDFCKKYLSGFYDNFLIFENKDFAIDYLVKNNGSSRDDSCNRKGY